ncbi:MAG: STAS domain-containing protein, partial [Dongiaceae bacterium]
MATAASWINASDQGSETVWSMSGEWTVHHAEAINRQLREMIGEIGKAGHGAAVVFNLANLKSLDTAGAWLLARSAQEWRDAGAEVSLRDLDPKMQDLLERVVEAAPKGKVPVPPRRTLLDWIAQIGAAVDGIWMQSLDLLAFFGALSIVFLRTMLQPRRLRMNSIISHVEQTG